MKKALSSAVIAVAALAALAGCGPKASHAGSKVTSDPQVKIDSQQAEHIISSCLPAGSLLTHHGRQRVWDCLFPPSGHAPAGFTRCAETAIFANMGTKASRLRLATDLLPHCFLTARNAEMRHK